METKVSSNVYPDIALEDNDSNKKRKPEATNEDVDSKRSRNVEDNDIGFVDIKKLEHSARMLQKNIKLILDEAPDVDTLNRVIASGSLDSLTLDNLRNNKLLHLAVQLKSLYDEGKVGIFDAILDNRLESENQDVVETAHQRLSTPEILTSVEDEKAAEPNEVNSEYPSLPPIRDPHLSARVFIHKSSINNKSYLYQSELISSHNERLEFLGDSVLNNIATIILYNRYPTAPEGELSKMRSYLVNNVTLAEFSLNYGFDRRLKSNINDAMLRQGKQKIFADIFEAYVGALSIENSEMGIIRDWLYKLFLTRLNQFDNEIKETEEVNKDAKLELYSLVGTAAFHPTYHVIQKGDGASKPYKVECKMGNDSLGTGVAPGLKEAGLRAAMIGLKNKPLLEKYIQLRLNTDRTHTVISQKPLIEPVAPIEPNHHNFDLPLKSGNDEEIEFDSDARNKLYAILNKNFNLFPEYNCTESDQNLFTAELIVNNTPLAIATDLSKKRAMAKAAKLVLDNPSILGVLTQ